MQLPVPSNEAERLKALNDYNLLDTLPEEQFDRLTKLASIICDVPIALISLIDKDRQWFKSNVGLNAAETSREISFCQYSILGSDVFEVKDTLDDNRFKENPLVTGYPNMRFYDGYPIIDPDGLALGTLCVIDQTPKTLSENQKLALKTLAEDIMLQILASKQNEERKRYEKFFMMSFDMICITGANGFFKKVNPAITTTLGWSEEELMQKSFFDFIHPDDLHLAEAELKNMTAISTLGGLVIRLKTKDNSYRTIQWISNSDHEKGEVFAIGRDITQLKIDGAVLENTIQQNLALIKSIPDLLFRMDVGGNFLDFKAFEKDTYIPPENIIGSNFLHLPFPEKMKREVFDKHKAALATNELQTCEYELETNGVNLFFEARIIKSGENETISICRDITQKKESEIEIIKAKKIAESANEAKSHFIANMSHEIRTPMNAILGFTSLIKNSKLKKEQAEYVSNIKIASENLLSIINDVLDISKIEAGMMKIEKSVVNLSGLLKNIFSILKVRALEKNLDISLYISPDCPDYILGDSIRLSQVLINLITNAIKFTENGFVKISVTTYENDSNRSVINFTIQDSGIGIAPEKSEIIFERFIQESDEITKIYGGTGLGLSIVKNIVQLLNGKIYLESIVGSGSKFTVSFPLEKVSTEQLVEFQNEKNNAESAINFNLKKLNILLAEDNRMNQQYVKTILDDHKLNCTIAANGKIAIELVKQNKYDLILMDIQMPIMDGYEAAAIIRNKLKVKTPIIAITANTTSKFYDKFQQAGMNAFLSKPFKPNELIDKIALIYGQVEKGLSTKPKQQKKATRQHNDGLIDLDFMKEQVSGNINAVNELIEIFLHDTPLEIQSLENAIAKKDLSVIANTAHKLVSSFSILGIESAVKILKEMELLAENKKPIKDIKALLTQFLLLNNETTNELLELKMKKFQRLNYSENGNE